MKAYKLSGVPGTGKSTIGRELKAIGYSVIETDSEPGLSGYVNKDTLEPVTTFPPQPFSEAWLEAHIWYWQPQRFAELLKDMSQEIIFFCGGAVNEQDFANYFTKSFVLIIDNQTLRRRLQQREPLRWTNDSYELARTLANNKMFLSRMPTKDTVLIDTSLPVSVCVQTIINSL